MMIRRTDDVAWRRIEGETVVVHLARHRMYALNDAGGRLWEEMEAPLVDDRLAELLKDPASAAFLADLSAEALIESDRPLPPPPAPAANENNLAAPRIEWREEVRRFAGDCLFVPGQSDICTGSPFTS